MAARYSADTSVDRAALDKAYAAAMQLIAVKYPGDDDIATLYAEALMDLQPWDYWEGGTKPKGRTEEIIDLLERVLARSPYHPGAIHYYIHMVEASGDPKRALPYAQRLGHLAAVAVEDRLAYSEPPYWYYPTRQSLGAVLLLAGEVDQAEQILRTSLQRAPNNGWALFGLMKVYEQRGDTRRVRSTKDLLGKAWIGQLHELHLARL